MVFLVDVFPLFGVIFSMTKGETQDFKSFKKNLKTSMISKFPQLKI